MTAGQAIGAFRFFTGFDADAARTEAHFRRLAHQLVSQAERDINPAALGALDRGRPATA